MDICAVADSSVVFFRHDRGWGIRRRDQRYQLGFVLRSTNHSPHTWATVVRGIFLLLYLGSASGGGSRVVGSVLMVRWIVTSYDRQKQERPV